MKTLQLFCLVIISFMSTGISCDKDNETYNNDTNNHSKDQNIKCYDPLIANDFLFNVVSLNDTLNFNNCDLLSYSIDCVLIANGFMDVVYRGLPTQCLLFWNSHLDINKSGEVIANLFLFDGFDYTITAWELPLLKRTFRYDLSILKNHAKGTGIDKEYILIKFKARSLNYYRELKYYY